MKNYRLKLATLITVLFCSSMGHTEGVSLLGEVVWPLREIKADQAHQIGFDGQGQKICLISGGVRRDHPQLRGVKLKGINVSDTSKSAFLTKDDTKRRDSTDLATILVGRRMGEFMGVAPAAELIVVSVYGDANSGTSFQNLVKGLSECVRNSANIVLLDVMSNVGSVELWDTFEKVANSGATLVAGTFGTKNFPAAISTRPEIITAGVIDQSLHAPFTLDPQAKIDFVAPGMNIPVLADDGSIEFKHGPVYSAAYLAGVEALRRQASGTALSGIDIDLGQGSRKLMMIDALKSVSK